MPCTISSCRSRSVSTTDHQEPVRSGRSATTTETSGMRKSLRSNYDISTGIRSNEGWQEKRETGSGVAFDTTLYRKLESWKSNRNGLREIGRAKTKRNFREYSYTQVSVQKTYANLGHPSTLAPEDASPPLILLTVCHSERLYREEIWWRMSRLPADFRPQISHVARMPRRLSHSQAVAHSTHGADHKLRFAVARIPRDAHVI